MLLGKWRQNLRFGVEYTRESGSVGVSHPVHGGGFLYALGRFLREVQHAGDRLDNSGDQSLGDADGQGVGIPGGGSVKDLANQTRESVSHRFPEGLCADADSVHQVLGLLVDEPPPLLHVFLVHGQGPSNLAGSPCHLRDCLEGSEDRMIHEGLDSLFNASYHICPAIAAIISARSYRIDGLIEQVANPCSNIRKRVHRVPDRPQRGCYHVQLAVKLVLIVLPDPLNQLGAALALPGLELVHPQRSILYSRDRPDQRRKHQTERMGELLQNLAQIQIPDDAPVSLSAVAHARQLTAAAAAAGRGGRARLRLQEVQVKRQVDDHRVNLEALHEDPVQKRLLDRELLDHVPLVNELVLLALLVLLAAPVSVRTAAPGGVACGLAGPRPVPAAGGGAARDLLYLVDEHREDIDKVGIEADIDPKESDQELVDGDQLQRIAAGAPSAPELASLGGQLWRDCDAWNAQTPNVLGDLAKQIPHPSASCSAAGSLPLEPEDLTQSQQKFEATTSIGSAALTQREQSPSCWRPGTSPPEYLGSWTSSTEVSGTAPDRWCPCTADPPGCSQSRSESPEERSGPPGEPLAAVPDHEVLVGKQPQNKAAPSGGNLGHLVNDPVPPLAGPKVVHLKQVVLLLPPPIAVIPNAYELGSFPVAQGGALPLPVDEQVSGSEIVLPNKLRQRPRGEPLAPRQIGHRPAGPRLVAPLANLQIPAAAVVYEDRGHVICVQLLVAGLPACHQHHLESKSLVEDGPN
ncbi:hypothetical protein OIY81_3326 [Cryptosporidium canis]|uniref:Uncharacterized protein n=1 Tax=Cryptosporidium canis TaxID=195482 RepID=A0ABQ8P467_9CRYT|nr:hypothetical protein OIY81_3326 [Cryptosporidium canis]KAJ1607692.1 hypothetical protein OJ252_2786 [Cryptosporidium canis]